MRWSPVALVPLAVIGIAVPSMARESFPTQLTINYYFDDANDKYTWEGKVKSDKQGCVDNRKVFLLNENSPNPLNVDRVGANGRYVMRQGLDGLNGNYWTKVKRLERASYTCKGARSANTQTR